MLEVRDLHAWYGKSHILQGVTLDVAAGEVTSLLGRNVRRLRRLVFMLSAGMAAIAAVATAHDVGFDPHGGLKAVLIGMAATIIGGRASLTGAAIVGFSLGIIRNEVVWLTSSQWEDAITFLLLALVLFLRPEGLLGTKFRLEERV